MKRNLSTSSSKSCMDTICCCGACDSKYRGAVIKAVLVRLFLIAHIILTIWRVTVAWNDQRFWLWSLGSLLIAFEGQFTILKNKGIEWKWFCPLFAIYLGTVLPLIWFLEIAQMNKYLDSNPKTTIVSTIASTTTSTILPTTQEELGVTTTRDNITAMVNITLATFTNETTSTVVTTASTELLTTTQGTNIIDNLLQSVNADTWVVIVEESLVYLIVIGRWLLPRGGVTREALSDLLIDYLAIASDVMELFALFDEDKVRGSVDITYAILGIWSLSFLQFIPVLATRKAILTEKRASIKKQKKSTTMQNACGENGLDIFVTLTAFLLQDGPFLVLRIFIIVYLQLLTYSLVFFVLKNIFVVLLLGYRLFILCTQLPCCFKKEGVVEDVEYVDFDNPIELPPKDISIINPPVWTSNKLHTNNAKIKNFDQRQHTNGLQVHHPVRNSKHW